MSVASLFAQSKRSNKEIDMSRKLVTCPMTVQLEHVEYEAHPLGRLVTSCTRFEPECEVTCGGTCASVLDRWRTTSADIETEEVTHVDIHRMVGRLRT
jgi:hypothetical protein